MSEHENQKAHVNESVLFEPTDVSTKPVVLSVASLAVFTVVFTIIGHYVFFGFAAREQAASAPPSPLAAKYAATEPPEPRLQIHPVADLAAFRATTAKTLSTLAWVDQNAGIVQVPIERAMEILLAKGLPARAGEVPLSMQPKGVAPRQYSEGSGAPDWGDSSAHAPGGSHGEEGAASHAPASEAHGH